MRVGLTYDLRADYLAEGYTEEETGEFDRVDTIDALCNALAALGHETDRIGNAKALIRRLASGDRWDLVFNIAEGLYGYGREAQVPAILDVYQIPYTFSDPLVLSMTLHKGMTKRVFLTEDVPTTPFAEVHRIEDVEKVRLPLPLFVKPIAEGTGKGVNPNSVIRRREDLAPQCRWLLEKYQQPVIVETYLPGREMTCGILGTGDQARCLGTIEVVLLAHAEKDVYSYVNKERCEELVEYRLVRPQDDPEVKLAEEVSLAAWRAMGCCDAGRVDVRSDANGKPHVLEINPLAGIHPEHSDLPIICNKIGFPYLRLIEGIVESARSRWAKPVGVA